LTYSYSILTVLIEGESEERAQRQVVQSSLRLVRSPKVLDSAEQAKLMHWHWDVQLHAVSALNVYGS